LAGPDTPASQSLVKAVDKSALVEMRAVMVDDSPIGGSGDSLASLGTDTAGIAEMNKTEAQYGTTDEPLQEKSTNE
jgi:hypothetical protein